MDYYNGDNNYNQNRQKTNGFAVASLILGIAAIVTCCCGVFAVPLGSLSILFAVLSRKKGEPMPGMSIAGIITSVIGIIFGVILLVFTFRAMTDENFVDEYLNPVYENAYGMSFEEFMEQFGYTLE